MSYSIWRLNLSAINILETLNPESLLIYPTPTFSTIIKFKQILLSYTYLSKVAHNQILNCPTLIEQKSTVQAAKGTANDQTQGSRILEKPEPHALTAHAHALEAGADTRKSGPGKV